MLLTTLDYTVVIPAVNLCIPQSMEEGLIQFSPLTVLFRDLELKEDKIEELNGKQEKTLQREYFMGNKSNNRFV